MVDAARACRTVGCQRFGQQTDDRYCGSCGADAGGPPVPAAGDAGAQRPTGTPSIATTIVITLLFGLFGAIPAAIHTARARQQGNARPPYWRAFGFTFLGSIVIDALLIIGLVAAIGATANQPSTSVAQPPAEPTVARTVPTDTGNGPHGNATDPAGDVTMAGGADLTGLTWSTNGNSIHFSFAFDGGFSADHNLTMYLKSTSDADNNCPGLNGANVALNIVQGGQLVVSTIDPGGVCADRTAVYTGMATQESDGWGVDLDLSDLGIDFSSGPVEAVVLSSTQTGPDTETVIQDQLPDSDLPPIEMDLS
jgi:hypothetical protein